MVGFRYFGPTEQLAEKNNSVPDARINEMQDEGRLISFPLFMIRTS
jgi:hypothetical protein